MQRTTIPTDYYTRGRPRAPRVTNQQTTIPVAAHAPRVTNQQTTIPAGRGTASGNKPTDYYTRGRPRASGNKQTNQQTTIPVAAHARLG